MRTGTWKRSDDPNIRVNQRAILTREVPILKQCTLAWKKKKSCEFVADFEMTRKVTNG